MKFFPLSGKFPHDRTIVYSTMLAPDDEGFRVTYEAIQHVIGYELDVTGNHLLSADFIRTLLNSPSREQFGHRIGELTRSALLAGMVLTILFITWKYPEVLGKRSTGGYSINRAIHCCNWIARKDGWCYGDGKQFPLSERIVKNAWARHRSVAHLWAAVDWNKVGHWATWSEELYPENFAQTMRAARYFELFGLDVTLTNKQNKSTPSILDAESLWRIPDNFAASMPIPVNGLIFQDSLIAKALRNYAATK